MSEENRKQDVSCECSGPSDFMRDHVSRRGFVTVGSGGLLSLLFTTGMEKLAWAQGGTGARAGRAAKSVILLWMGGGPSHIDTWDPKPTHQNGGGVKALPCRVRGMTVSEYFPRIASEVSDKIAIIRSMNSTEADHMRATYLLHTGYTPLPTMQHPNMGAVVAKEKGDPEFELPHFISINGGTIGSGFLGATYTPLVVNAGQPLDNINPPNGVDKKRLNERMQLLSYFETRIASVANDHNVQSHTKVYRKAERLMNSTLTKAFDIASEPKAIRDSYGNSNFGRGALTARRLIEAGVRFVQVGGTPSWDMHNNIQTSMRTMGPQVDNGMASLIKDLDDRDLLRDTMVIWMGEFGRTPNINGNQGRDHYSRAFSVVVAGGGIKGGQVIGSTSAGGEDVADRPVQVPDLIASVYHSLGVDGGKIIYNTLGRPMRLVGQRKDGSNGEVIRELFGV